ncbi:Facilitated trehalose transporter Tret1, partial [Blattella germanica]
NRVRGALGSFFQLLIVIGLLFEYVIGPYVSYTTLVVASAAVAILFAVAFFFVPESPYQYLAKGNRDEATTALMWLRGQSRKGASLEESMRNKSKLSDLIATRGNIKALYLSLGLVTSQQLSGINAVLFYTQNIFKASGGSLKPEVATIIVGVVMLLASCVTPLVVDRLGRRILLLISAIVMGISEIVLGVFFKMSSDEVDVSNIGNASACTAGFCWFLAFFITKFFADVVEVLGGHTAFWIFAGCCFLSAVFVFILLPETKGKSFQEIQDILNK